MDLTNPIKSVIPSVEGDVLVVLAMTHEPLSASQVARLSKGRVSRTMVNRVLSRLADTGVVTCEVRPPAKLYRLNRDHVAAEGIESLAGMRAELLRRMRTAINNWSVPPDAVWLFGSAARGEGRVDSDVDLLVVRPQHIDAEDPEWVAQVDALPRSVSDWSGNAAEILEMTSSQLQALVEQDDALVKELRRDAMALAGAPARIMLHAGRAVLPDVDEPAAGGRQ